MTLPREVKKERREGKPSLLKYEEKSIKKSKKKENKGRREEAK